MWSDFDPRKGTLRVNRTIRKEKGGRLVTGNTKTYAGTRTIVLPDRTEECEEKLAALIREMKQEIAAIKSQTKAI